MACFIFAAVAWFLPIRYLDISESGYVTRFFVVQFNFFTKEKEIIQCSLLGNCVSSNIKYPQMIDKYELNTEELI